MAELTKEQKKALADLAVKTAKQEGVQKVRRWTDVGDARPSHYELQKRHGRPESYYDDDEVPF